MIAVIPARRGSVRLPGKNMMSFCGHPLIEWTINQALAVFHPDSVYVVSDDEAVIDLANKCGTRTHRERTSLVPSALNAVRELGHYKSDRMLVLQPTFPLRSVGFIEKFMLFGEVHAFNMRTMRNGVPTGNIYSVHPKDLADNWINIYDEDDGVDIDTIKDFNRAEKIMAERLAQAGHPAQP